MNRSRKLRTGLAAALATGLVAAFAALGGGSIAHSALSSAQYQYGKNRVAICHKGKKTIMVAQPAVAAHLRHGDQLVTCASVAAKKAKKAKAAAAKAKAGKPAEQEQGHESSGSKGKGHGKP